MKVGIVMPIFNRPEYLCKTLKSIVRTLHPHLLYLINDASTVPATNTLFESFMPSSPTVIKHVNPVNQGIAQCLRQGWQRLAGLGCDVLANLDSDTLVKPGWLNVLLNLNDRFPERIVTGFHTHNHTIVENGNDYYLKKTAGGINFLFRAEVFAQIDDCLVGNGWDWIVCERMQKLNRPFVVSRPSVVQHLGKEGIHSRSGRYDVATDFDPHQPVMRLRHRRT